MTGIKDIREKTGLTRMEMARRLGIPYRTMEDWEAGRRVCPEYVVELIAFRIDHDKSFCAEKQN